MRPAIRGALGLSITYYQINLEELIPRLMQFFRDRREILLAAVFGSAVRRLVGDLDLAILFRGKSDLRISAGLRRSWRT